MTKAILKCLKTIAIIAGCTAGIIILVAAFWVGRYFWRPNPKPCTELSSENPFMTRDTMITAHRSGGGIVPEETMAAFQYCVENDFGINIFEFDLHLTADNVLVLLHDSVLDRTSDSETVFGTSGVTAHDKTYDELRKLNMGARFVNDAGETPYAQLSGSAVPDNLRIAGLDEVLDYLTASGDFYFIIEIKDRDEIGKKAADLLYENLNRRNLLNRVSICSFSDSILAYVGQNYPDTVRGAGTAETLKFYFAALFNWPFYKAPCSTMQPPFGKWKWSYGANFATRGILNYAHKHGIALQYWTVNSEENMEYLLRLGVDGITTDYPDRLHALKQKLMLNYR